MNVLESVMAIPFLGLNGVEILTVVAIIIASIVGSAFAVGKFMRLVTNVKDGRPMFHQPGLRN